MAAAVVVRPIRREDAPEAARLCGQLGYPVDAATLQARLDALLARPTHAAFVAAGTGDGHPLLGLVAVEYRLLLELGERAEIVAMVVDAGARRQGLGRRLIDAACGWATAQGATSVFLRSNVVRPEAHVFYPGLGFQRTKTQHVYLKLLPRRA